MNTLNYHSTENGFTLMELMIVIAIISILSSVAIPAYHGYIQKAALTDVLQTLSPYRSAVELCHYEHQYNQCHADASFMPQQFRSRYLTDIHVANGKLTAHQLTPRYKRYAIRFLNLIKPIKRQPQQRWKSQ